MSKDEALKLALEALENHCGNYKLDDAGCERWNKAVAAIKEALAQDELCSSQEPVGRISADCEGILRQEVMLYTDKPLKIGTAVYTTLPKRPWVGLTDEQRNYCVETPFVSQQWANIEDKLRELNT